MKFGLMRELHAASVQERYGVHEFGWETQFFCQVAILFQRLTVLLWVGFGGGTEITRHPGEIALNVFIANIIENEVDRPSSPFPNRLGGFFVKFADKFMEANISDARHMS